MSPAKRKGTKAPANEPIIDAEFQSRIPPLTQEEAKLLEESIISEGCREPLIVWCGRLVDGHHRLDICKRNKVPYKKVELHRSDREQVLDWIDRNQLGRRNLHPDVAALLRGRVYERKKKRLGTNRYSEKVRHNDAPRKGIRTSVKLAEEFGVSPRTVERDGTYAAAVDTLKAIAPELEAQVIRGEGPPRKRVIEAAQAAQESPEKAKKILGDIQPHVSHSSGQQEWYTPEKYITAAKKVIGQIDIDPASCAEANETVRATTYYSTEDDGLTKEWNGKVWLNPPYAEDLVSRFCKKLISEHLAGRTTEAILLTNNATETGWFQDISGFASAICSPRGRIRYERPGGDTPGTPLQGQVFMYLGPNAEVFAEYFSEFGAIYYPAPPAAPPALPPEPTTTHAAPAPAKPQPPAPRPLPEEYRKYLLGYEEDRTSPIEKHLQAARDLLGDGHHEVTSPEGAWEGVVLASAPEGVEWEIIDDMCVNVANGVMREEITRAIAIVCTATTSISFNTMCRVASAICFPRTCNHIVFHFGTKEEANRFAWAFHGFGPVMTPFRRTVGGQPRTAEQFRKELEAR